MRLLTLLLLCAAALTATAQTAEPDWSKKDWTKHETTEFYPPTPPIVTPAKKPGGAPSDAIVLFDGKNMGEWMMAADSSASKWKLSDSVMTVAPHTGDLKTRRTFGSCQLHVEFKIPADSKNSKEWGDSGNSGVFLQERYEIQIFDSWHNEVPIYANGQCGSVYKQAIPLANACSKPGEWNTYDIFYTAPTFRPENGTPATPAYVTVVHNGVLTLNHFEIQGTIKWIGVPAYEPHNKAAIQLQGHGSPVSFRNIWIREL